MSMAPDATTAPPSESVVVANEVAASVPGYRVQRCLGEGTEGGAFEAVDASSGRRVVLKQVPAGARAIVRRAFEVLGQIASPHLPPPHALVETGEPEPTLWLATQWVEGEPLAAGPGELVDAVDVGRQVAHGLAALHEAGTHHGDLSPGNVVVDGRGRAVIVDLGQLGRQGTGTPGFLAPETLAGGGGPAADLFALGCLLCWRWTGEVPWPRPEALLRVRSAEDVLAALPRRESTELTPSLRGLLGRLLHPDPRRRPARARDVVRRLEQIQTELQRGEAPSRWWIPDRLPYRGVDLKPALEAIDAGARLVMVTGPPGSGRTRAVESIIGRLQAGGKAARLVEPDTFGSGWLEAWMSATSSVDALGLLGDPQAGEPQARRRDPSSWAATLRAAAALSTGTCVLPVELAVADAVGRDERIARVDLRPWTDDEIERAVTDMLDDRDARRIGAWVQTLAQATGGWAGSVSTALLACARCGVAEPSAATIAEALRQAGADGLALDEQTARDVLELRWGGDTEVAARLPEHLRDGDRPRGAAVAAAKRKLGTRVQTLARTYAERLEQQGRGPSLLVGLDAGRPDDIVAALQAHGSFGPDEPVAAEVVTWAEAEHRAVPPIRAAAARVWLARGRPDRAMALVRGHTEDPGCALQAARAWQRLGKTDEALRVLERLQQRGEPWEAAAVGLQLRVLVDRGAHDRSEALARSLDEAARGPEAATAWLWAAYTAVVRGERDEAQRRLAVAREALGGRTDAEAWSARARIEQLVGNLRHDQGDLAGAREAFEQALDAFGRAGEAAGGLAVRGSLAALCVATLDLDRGVELARATVRGLLAGQQVSALPEAAMNLVQILRRLGAWEEAQRLHLAVDELMQPRDRVTDLTRGRLARVAADVEALRLAVHGVPSTDASAWKTAERTFAVAARKLESAGAHAEAADAWLQATQIARAGRRFATARTHLSRARAMGDADGSAVTRVAIAAERVRLAAAAQDCNEVLGEALRELDAATGAGSRAPRRRLHAAGRLELSWAHDRALWAALRSMAGPDDPRRRAVARRLLGSLETIMKKTPRMDRPAARASLTAEAGEPDVLAELLEDAEPQGPAARPVASPPGGRTQRLLRMYRRFAREDRLEPLLEQVVDAMMDLTDAERGAVVVVQPSGVGTDGPERLEVTRELSAGTEGFRFSRSVIDRVLADGEPVLSVDAAADERFDGSRSISHLNLRSVLAVPLRFRGKLLGAAYVDHRLRRGNFDEGDLAHMEAFGELAALAVAHAQILGEVREQAGRLQRQGAELEALLEAREAEVVELREEVRQQVGEGGRAAYRGIVGNSEPMRRIFRLIDRLADTDVPVVVFGESGTGKELVARAIHDAGSRAAGPFVAENCGAIPETLLESILFGHAKGAFTGASKAKPGLFEAASGGTIFLDEVSEMSAAMQTKLLRVLQEGEVRRVGENAPRRVDVRVITASNRDLEAMVEQGGFRRDLFYRINVVRIDLPALRDRVEDIPTLIEHLATRHGEGRKIEVTAAAMRLLSGYAWPGNVRELENEVQRWIALADGRVGVDDLSAAVLGRADLPEQDGDDLEIRPRVDRLERELIARALERTDGNQTKAAELLGLSRYGLQKKLKRLDA